MPRPTAGLATSVRACLCSTGLIFCLTISATSIGNADDDTGPAPTAKSATEPSTIGADDIKPGGENQAVAHSEVTHSDDVPNLVIKLGDAQYAVRENASNQLVQKGLVAKPQLLAALESSDAEVRFRAKRILAAIVDADFQRRLSAFAADTDGKLDLNLPGWSVFKQFAGNDKAARDVFVEMEQAESSLLEAYQQGAKPASEKLRAELAGEPSAADRAVMARMRGRAAVVMPSGTQNLGSILSWLFVAADPQVPITDDVAGKVVMLPESQAFLQAMQASNVHSNRRVEVFRRILGHWVARDVGANYVLINLSLAYSYDLKESLNSAVAVLKQPQPTGDRKYQLALLLVARFGSKEQLPLLEPFLKDTTVCYDNSGPENKRIQTEMRDIALFTAVKIADLDVKKFGLGRAVNLAGPRLDLQPFGFETDADQSNTPPGMHCSSGQRDAAIQKWEAWQKGQESAANEKKNKQSTTENSG
jgi:hypothetical protein